MDLIINVKDISLTKRIWLSIESFIHYQLIILCVLFVGSILYGVHLSAFLLLEATIILIVIYRYVRKSSYLVYNISFTNNEIEIHYYYRYFRKKCLTIQLSDLKQRYYNKPDYCGFGYYWSLELLKNNKFIIQLSEKDKIGWTREKMLEVKHQLDIRNVQESGFTTTFF